MGEKLSKGEWKALSSLIKNDDLVSIRQLHEQAEISYEALVGKGGYIYRLSNNGLVKSKKVGTKKMICSTDKAENYCKEFGPTYDFFFKE